MSEEQKTIEVSHPRSHGVQHQHPLGDKDVKNEITGKVPWSPWMAVVYAILVYFAAQFIGGLAVYLYPLLQGKSAQQAADWLSSSVAAQFWYVLFAELLTFGAIWWFIRRHKSNLRAIGWKRLRLSDPGMALAGFAIYFVGYAVLLAASTHLFSGLNIDQKQELGFDNASGGPGLILTFLSLVVMPPIVEETVFRGFVYTGIRNKIRPIGAALLTSLLFAAAHLQFGSGKPLLWVAALDTFTLSLVLCYLRQTTDSLWPGVLLHGLKNSIAFISLFLLHVH
jgi:membrane protease YdiL (CAAX protease family)